MSQNHTSHAVVIGASVAGLLAARALSERFDAVTLLERDEFPDRSGDPRKGVPQGRHAHGLLGQGRLILDELFPNFTAELERQGAERGDLGSETLWYHSGGFHQRHESGIVGLFASRPLIESQVRKQLLALPNVTAVTNIEVTGLHVNPIRNAVVGVHTRRLDNSGTEILSSDLVVDATGRGSRVPTWLADTGLERPIEERVDVGLCYTTRIYRRDVFSGDRVKGIVKAGTPSNSRGGAVLAIEGNRWIVSMGGFGDDHAPLDDVGYLAYARGMGAPHFAHVIERAEPLTDLTSLRFPANVRRRYERSAHFPSGLLVIGDAICCFNPVYGQGITVAAMEAMVLRDELRSGTTNLHRRFFRRAARIIDTAWTVVTGTDARILDIPEYNTRVNRMLGGYLDTLHIAATRDPQIASAFLRVANVMTEPTTLLTPAMMWRVRREARAARDGLGSIQ